MFNVLIVEDDIHTARLFADTLRDEGFIPYLASNGAQGLEILAHHKFDLAVVDVMMPVMDGITFTRKVRENNPTIPLLIVSAKGTKEDIHDGFIVGIDDYMVKPIDTEEMLLRIKALLRRSAIRSEKRLTVGTVTLDMESYTVSRGKTIQELPKKEFLLLLKLLSYPGRIFTRAELIEEIWGMDTDSWEETVTVHINRLRARFKDYSEFTIETIRGLGYRGVRHL